MGLWKKKSDLKNEKIIIMWKEKMNSGWQPIGKWEFTGVNDEGKDFLWKYWKLKNRKGIIW